MKVHAAIIIIVSSSNIVGRLLGALLHSYYCKLSITIGLTNVTLSTTKKGGFLLLSMSEVPHSSKDEGYEFHYTCDGGMCSDWEWMRVVIQNLNFMSPIKHLVSSKECTNEVIRGVHDQ